MKPLRPRYHDLPGLPKIRCTLRHRGYFKGVFEEINAMPIKPQIVGKENHDSLEYKF